MADRYTPAGRRPQTLLFAPSYFDFVRLRTLLHAEDFPFTAISEYSEPSDVARARAALGKGELEGMLLYTERAHFFRRHLLRGRARVAFYGLPAYEHFYPEIVQMLAGGGAGDGARGGGGVGEVVALFCRFDWQPLRRLVGDERAAAMVGGGSATSFLFQ
jgi:U3 small nucleolar RNA-associated protein 25